MLNDLVINILMNFVVCVCVFPLSLALSNLPQGERARSGETLRTAEQRAESHAGHRG